ncbi:uncharacterized protein LOC136068176 [Quercus suber]|uniref:uncharacterized protein LOC136068176 n=1 Tax=Quercus suber TaxID=58331 RepID=UPI0032DF4B3A
MVVLTQYPIKAVLRSADYTGRVAKWGTILGAFDVKYMPRTSVKGQVLADLVAEFAKGPEEIETSQDGMDEKSVGLISAQPISSWTVYVDGAANQRGSRVGLVLISPEEVIIEKSLRLGFSATNNEAEYEALLMGMAIVNKLGEKTMEIFSDSGLVVGQVRGELKARDTRMQEYLSQVNQISSARSWMDPIIIFLEKDILPEDKSKAKKIRRKAPCFWPSEDKKLYKRSYSGLYLLCVRPEASEDLLEELHEGICGSHTGGRSLSHRTITQGYWWPGMQKKALEYVRKCDQCQRFAPNIHQPGGVLNPLSSPWPFAQWDLDIFGPFPRAVGNKKYLLVGMDYFTKWVEAEPLANIRDVDVKRFLLRNIITRFGVPQTLISDNSLQFDSKAFRRTTPRRSTGETPFSMTYGAEAVIPIETGFPTLRTSNFTLDRNDELLRKSLDLIDERREKAMVQLACYQHKLKQGYDANVKLRPLAPGDLVLRKVLGNTKNPAWGKLGSNWEEPYRITSVAGIRGLLFRRFR